MQVLIRTDRNIEGTDELSGRIEEIVRTGFSLYEKEITRVNVHLSDSNKSKSGQNDKRCVMEVRLAGLQPLAVSDDSDEVNLAVTGALNKALAALRTIQGRRKER